MCAEKEIFIFIINAMMAQFIKISYHHKPNYLFSVTLGISPTRSYLWCEYCKYTKYYTMYQHHVVSGYLEVVAITQ